MADIDITTSFAFYPFTSGSAASGDDGSQVFYDPQTSVPTTFEVMNGWLDWENADGTWSVDKTTIQKGQVTRAGITGATLNADYFGTLFADATTTNNNSEDLGAYLTIPGGALDFYLPYAASLVTFTWTINWGNDSTDSTTIVSAIRFFLNGVVQDSQRREVSDTIVVATSVNRDAGRRDRHWTGHLMATNLTAGWHKAELRLLAPGSKNGTWADNPLQTRVRVRSMRYIAIR